MPELLDFSHCAINPLKWFGGANGNKISITYAGEDYMLKFPTHPRANPTASYTNSCISEYLACHIIQSLGLPAQDTLLGNYRGKIVVACKDLETNGYRLKDFAFLKNTIIDSEQNGYGTELEDVLLTFDSQQIMPPNQIRDFFWDMFIADALVGNFDRHNGNWGFLINTDTHTVKLAPIYDCASCLYPQLDESAMIDVLHDPQKIHERIYVFPNSALRLDGQKLNYAQFLMTTQDQHCLAAIKRVCSKIDMEKINALIAQTPFISAPQKQFYQTMLAKRNALLLQPALARDAVKTLPSPAVSLSSLCTDAKAKAAALNADNKTKSPQAEREQT